MVEANALRDELSRWRTAGELFVWSAPHERGEDAEQTVRDLLSARPGPLNASDENDLDDLDGIDTDTAHRLLAHVLQFDLAYDAEMIDRDVAERLAGRVIKALPPPVRWWTNGSIGLPGGGPWTGLTDATFDTGVIGVSRDQVLVVWFMDED